MLGPSAARLLQALAKPQLSDSDIQDYLDRLDAQEAAPGSALPPSSSYLAGSARPAAPSPPARDGGMRLSSRVQEIVVSEGRCTPRQCDLLAGGRVVLRVQGGPPQPFAIGRDVEDAVITPAIPAGTSYEWTPPEPGRYFVRSEVYPSLRSEIRVLRPSETAEPVGTASSSSASTTFSRFGSSMAAVDEFVPFPALKAAGTSSYSRGTQTGGSSFGRQAGAFNPGPVLSRFQADSLGPDEEDSDDEGGGFVAPPGGLRHRGRAAAAAPQRQQQEASSRGALPELGRPAAPAGLDGFSVISSGSGGSPRSGSGSERSTGSAPLYVERRRVPGMLQPTYSAVHSGRSSYSDSRSGAGSEERQPLLYSVGGQAGYSASYGPGGLRAYPAAGAPPRMGAEEARTQKCPRCRKEYLSTINQRRCIASHLGASGGAKAARGVADPKQLAEFWDGLSEAERRTVMAVKEEHNGERTLRELSCQILHRKRPGATDGLTKEQRRLHLAGKMLHDFVTGELLPGGSQLVSVLSQVSEGTFLFERNAINRDEVLSGNNVEAGLGALVTKRLVGAHLAAKQAAAAAMQEQLEREQEDQEAQQAAKKSKQQGQQQGQGASKKQAKGSKAKGKPGAPAAKAGSKPAPAAAAAGEAAAEPSSSSEGEADGEAEQAGPAGRPPPLQLPANGNPAAQQQAGDDELSPPSASGARYGASPLRASGAASQYTNFLFLAEEGPESAAAEDADGWRTAGSGRPSSRSSQQAGAKASANGTGSSKAAGRGSAAGAPAAGAPAGRPSSRTADRPAANGAAAAPAAAPKAAATNGKLSRSSAAPAAAAAVPTGKPQKQQQSQPREESFPALPAAAAGKPRPAAAAPAASPGFSYAAAASKVRKDSSKKQAGEGKQAQQEQQPQQTSWPVPGPVPGKGAKPAAPAPAATAAAAAAPVAPITVQQPAAEPAVASKQPEAATAAAAAAAANAPAAPQAAPVPAAAEQPSATAAAHAAAEAPQAAVVPAAAPAAAADEAAEVQRCASVTPPISDAGSPPPGPLPMPPGFAVPPAGWVGPDGAPLMPPPLPPGYYWAAMPAMPGMQFGNVDMNEVLPAGPWPYPPFYPPGAPPPFPLPPPGAMLPPGVPLPPHMLPYGEEGVLAPFPPGMPVPLPPEAAEQLAAAAAAHAAAADQPVGVPAAAGEQAAAAEGADSEAAATAEAAARGEASEPQQAAPAGEPRQPATAGPRKGFLALLQDAYGPAGAAQPPAAASRPQRDSGFDAAAAAAELQRRWQTAAPAAVPAQRPHKAAADAVHAAPRSASKGRPPSRGSSSGSLGSKSGKASALGGSSGRASPSGGPSKPVVVAVRAWSSDDSASDGPKWKIQAAPQPQQAQQGGATATQQQQQQQQ